MRDVKQHPIGQIYVLARPALLNATSQNDKLLRAGTVVTVVGPTYARIGFEEVLVLSPRGIGLIGYAQRNSLEEFEVWTTKMKILREGVENYTKRSTWLKIFGR